MSRVNFELTNGSFVLFIVETRRTLPVALKNNQANLFVFEGMAGEAPFTLSASVANETNINFRSSLNNNLDLCLWKRRDVSETMRMMNASLAGIAVLVPSVTRWAEVPKKL